MMHFDKLKIALPQQWRNWKTWAPIAAAVVLGLVAAKIAYDLSEARPAVAAAPRVERSPVVFAARDVAAGQALAAADLERRSVESDAAPAGAFATVEPVVGRVVRTALFAGQAVVGPQLAPVGTGAGLQARIPGGMRAVTIEIDEFRGVAGYLVPGCRVDLVTTIDVRADGDAEGEGVEGESARPARQSVDDAVSRTFVQNLEVLAVGRPAASTPEPDPDGPPMATAAAGAEARSVTLLATPEQAEAVELACRKGQPRLVLRSSGDGEVADRPGVTLAQLTAGPSDRAVAPDDAPAYASRPTMGSADVSTVLDLPALPAESAAPVRNERLVEFIRRGVIETTPMPLRESAPPVADATPAATREPDAPADLPGVIVDVPTDPVFPD